jgi:ketosteroid isomerase-like protein
MSKWKSVVLGCLGVLALLSAAFLVSAQARRERAIAENRELDRQIFQAVEALDAEKLLSFYWKSPDLLVVGPQGKVARGWETLKPVEENFYASLESAKIVEVVEDVKHADGDAVWSVLTIKYRALPKGGSWEEGVQQITELRRRIGGRWVIVFNHPHDLPPAAPKPPAP